MCSITDDGKASCSCIRDQNFLTLPEDNNNCDFNPCARVQISSHDKCAPNFEKGRCECISSRLNRPTSIPTDEGFYGKWGEWSKCPPNACRIFSSDLQNTKSRHNFLPILTLSRIS